MNKHVSDPNSRSISRQVRYDNDHQITASVTTKTEKPVIGRRAFLATAACSTLAVLSKRLESRPNNAMDEVLYLPAIRIAELIRGREISSVAVVKAHLDRIESVNPKIHAVCALAAEKALEEARRADEQLAHGDIRGPFHGVPMTIKDSIDTEGTVTTDGTTGRRRFVPDKDATIVHRLRNSGAILLGKTNTPELTMDFDTCNRLFHDTLNPYNLKLSPGGSSGGAAAIIAAGGSPFDFGSDTGGSIRIPSCFCGIAGIRPSAGLLPLTGHIINHEQGLIATLTRLGPLSRFVDDLYPLLKVTAGPDDTDKLARSIQLGDPSFVNIEKLHAAFHINNGIRAASTDVARTVQAAASCLSDCGAKVEESCPEVIKGLQEFEDFPITGDGGKWALSILERFQTPKSERDCGWVWSKGPLSQDEIERKTRLRNQFRSEMDLWMKDYDVLICPVTAKVGYPPRFSRRRDFDISGFTYTQALSHTDWPIAVVRCGTSTEGMPIGVQVVSKFGREDICLAVAKHLETSFGGWKQPPL